MGDLTTPLLLMSAIVYSLLNFISFLSAKDWKAAGKIGASYVVGIVVMVVFAKSTIGAPMVFFGMALGTLNTFDLILLGLVAPSIAGVGYNLKQAIDGKDTAIVPSLGGKPTLNMVEVPKVQTPPVTVAQTPSTVPPDPEPLPISNP